MNRFSIVFVGLMLLQASFANAADIENRESAAGGSSFANSFLERGTYNGYYPSKRSGSAHIDLSNDWELAGIDAPGLKSPKELPEDAAWIHVSEPTSVQMAHFKAGRLPDPYAGLNSKLYEPLEKKIWYYKKRFSVGGAKKSKYAMLYFEGLDYFSRVWLNGKLLGSHQGMNGGPMFEIGEILKFDSDNEIVVEVSAAHGGDRKNFNYRRPGRIVKAIATAAGSGTEPFFSFGMWGGVRIELLPHVHIERPFVYTKSVGENSAIISAEVEILAYLHSAKHQPHGWRNGILYRGTSENDVVPANGSFELEIEMSDAEGTLFKKRFPLSVHKGRNWFSTEIGVENPKLWWPNGMGEPNLYDVKFTLVKDGSSAEDSISFKTGIRKILLKPTSGPKILERWDNWLFEVNGREMFVKGANWMIPDVLCDLPDWRYERMLEMAKNCNIQMLRVWGGGPFEKDRFYEICDASGIMLWQDFTLWHQDAPLRPYNVWEEQVMLNVFRLRNSPALALWCGGNGFNPFSAGNTQHMGILERTLNLYDKTRAFVRSSSDAGNMHNYPDMDPCWYSRVFRFVPFISETGIHCVMSAKNVRKIVDASELGDLGALYEKSFAGRHPQLMNHFVEYEPSRIPRMLSRASHIDDMSNPSADSIAEATQIGAGEFYKILSEQTQSNFPLTGGLLPWVFGRSWPVFSAIMLVDGFGQPCAPYYFLKRTYSKNSVALLMPRLIWGKSEKIPMEISVANVADKCEDACVEINVYSKDMRLVSSSKTHIGTLEPSPAAKKADGGAFEIPESFEDSFFFIEAVLRDGRGTALSRSVYWPRCLKAAADPAFKARLETMPVPYKREFPWPSLKSGPWLKPTLAAARKSALKLDLLSLSRSGAKTVAKLSMENVSDTPAFMTRLDLENPNANFYSDDNFFWLAPREKKELKISLYDFPAGESLHLSASAWNSDPVKISIKQQH